ncbi:hypothetical protein SAURM35S_02868 [Streptomyces aurantiogriseus]
MTNPNNAPAGETVEIVGLNEHGARIRTTLSGEPAWSH